MPRIRWTPVVLSLSLVLVLGLGALAWKGAADSPDADQARAPSPRPALAVVTVQPQMQSLQQPLPANGNIAAWQEASIGSESSGLRLAEVYVNVGDTVRAGQELARFDPETVQADLAQARAALAQAQASAGEASANAARAQSLQASGALSAQQIQQYATAGQTAQARVLEAQAALHAQQLRLKHTRVHAPDSGVISVRTATVGAVLGAGTELFRMVRKGRLEWRAEVGAVDLPRLRVGMDVHVTAASGATVQGKLRMIAPTVDVQSRNALVYVDLPVHSDLRMGMYARGEFELGSRELMTVPLSAVVVRDGFSSVFEVQDGHVHMRRVKTGQRSGERIALHSGLALDAQVVERGGAFLSDGDRVQVTQPLPAAAKGQP